MGSFLARAATAAILVGWASASAAIPDCTLFVRAGFVPNGTADGRSPSTAYGTIALGVAAVRNAGDVVCVGPGLYVEGNIGPDLDGDSGAIDGSNARPIEIRGDPTGVSTGDVPGAVQMLPPTGLTPDLTPTTAFLLLGHHDILIDGFEISGFHDAGIQVRATAEGVNSYNVTLRNNIVTASGKGIDVVAQGAIDIEGNSTIGNGTTGISAEMCLVTSDAGRCRGTSGVPVLPTVSNNRSGGNGAHGVYIQAGDNAIVQNNTLYANGATGITLRECQAALVVNNLVYANTDRGIGVGKADLASPDTVILNNTFYGNGNWAIDIGSPGAGSPRAAVVNNLIWRNGDGQLGVGVLNENSGDMPVRPASTCGYIEGFNLTRDAYGPDTPYNNYDFFGDPLFVNAAGADGILGGQIVNGQFVDASADDDFHLRQLSGEGGVSGAVDTGSGPILALGLTGSTASDGQADAGTVDVGFHYGASAEQTITFAPPFMPLYVRNSGDDSNDGVTPNSAFEHIQTAAPRARGGVTVVVGAGNYFECNIHSPNNSGQVAFLADATGQHTGDLGGTVFIDVGHCVDSITGAVRAGEDGISLTDECDAVIDGFHVTGATEDGVRVDDHSDGSILRNNVVFGNAKRGVHVVDSSDVQVLNNLAYGNAGGIEVGGSCTGSDKTDCSAAGSPRALVQFNTVIKNQFDGIQVGDGIGNSSQGTVKYNVTASNNKGIEIGDDATRMQDLTGYTTGFNLIGDSLAGGVPRASSDLREDLSTAPLYLDPAPIDPAANWLSDQRFRLAQTAAGQAVQSVAVDWGDITAVAAGLADRTTRSDDEPDSGFVDLGYHYPVVPTPAGPTPTPGPLVGDCNGDGKVTVNELILAVNIALGSASMSECPAADINGDMRVSVSELIRAVNSALQT